MLVIKVNQLSTLVGDEVNSLPFEMSFVDNLNDIREKFSSSKYLNLYTIMTLSSELSISKLLSF